MAEGKRGEGGNVRSGVGEDGGGGGGEREGNGGAQWRGAGTAKGVREQRDGGRDGQ